MPYRVPLDERVAAGLWIDVQGAGSPIDESPPAWDYNTSLQLSREFQVDVEGIRKDCGLPADAELEACVRYWTSRSRLRTLCARSALPVEAGLHAVVSGADLGGVLTVETTIELAADVKALPPYVAHRAGSILWRQWTSVALEGDGGLLPLAPVSFEDQGYLPASAAWQISLDSTDWHHAALGSLLVLLNTDNATVRQGLDGKLDDTAAAVLWDTLQVDVVADLVGKALDDPDFPGTGSEQEVDEGSLARLVESLVGGYLSGPNELVTHALQRLRDVRSTDPSMFRAMVQDGLRYLGEATS